MNGKKTEAQTALTKLHRACGAKELFQGLYRSYTPLDDDGETYPHEGKAIQLTVEEVIRQNQQIMSDFLDIVATQEYNNCEAKADVVVDNQTVLEQVPVSYLLFLEKQLLDMKKFLSELPVLEIGENWTKNDQTGFYVSEPVKTNKTKKVLQHKVLYEATKEHPAQIETWNEDVVVGNWTTVKYSGGIPLTEKVKLVEKTKKLIDAVKFARETANNIDVKQVSVSQKIFDYLF